MEFTHLLATITKSTKHYIFSSVTRFITLVLIIKPIILCFNFLEKQSHIVLPGAGVKYNEKKTISGPFFIGEI